MKSVICNNLHLLFCTSWSSPGSKWLSDTLIWCIWSYSVCLKETLCVSSATSSETGAGAAWRGRPGLGHVRGTGLKGTPSGAVCVCTGVQWIPSYLHPGHRPPLLPRPTCSWCSAPPAPQWRSCVLREMDRDCMFSFTETLSGKPSHKFTEETLHS